MLENSSFDRMMGVLPNADGVDPANIHTNPDFPGGQQIPQAETTSRTMGIDPQHELDDSIRQMDGPCLGFVESFARHNPTSSPAARAGVMAYYPDGFLPVLHGLAREFAVCNRWFSSVPGPTWPNRLFVHSGTSLGHTDMPAGIFHPHLHNYDQPTVFQRLSEKGISWRIYFGDVPQSLLLLRQWEYASQYHQMNRFETELEDEGTLPQYTFIEPHYFGAEQDDQHPPSDVLRGEALIARVYNKLRANPALWRKTLLVILYDEHGGFYDHVEPPAATPPDSYTQDFSFDRYGPRVPAVLISPWIDRGQVLNDIFDHTSLLRYLTDKWDLGPLGNRTATANSFARYLQIRTEARTDTPASMPMPVLLTNPDTPALNTNQQALVGFTRFLETQIADLASELGHDIEETELEIGRRLLISMQSVEAHAGVAANRILRFFHLKKAATGQPSRAAGAPI